MFCSLSHQINSGFYCESNGSSTRLRDRKPRNIGSIPGRGTVFFLFSKASRRSAESIEPPIYSVGVRNTLPEVAAGWGVAPVEWR
jgi:hypothetical protein